jgi:hypothetical protein
MIISASRRTDIPAFFGEWLIQKIERGYAVVKNPFNPQQQKTVSLRRENVDCFVFWTKNAMPFMAHLQKIHELGYPFYFLYTITSYGADLEKNLPHKSSIIENFKQIVNVYGPGRAVWRYDPIVLTTKYDVNYHTRAFAKLTEMLEGCTHVCLFSFLENYRKLKNRRWPEGFIPVPDGKTKTSLIANLKNIAASRGIELSACCNTFDGISQPGCINADFIQSVAPGALELTRDKHQRKNCHCIKSADIGSYNTCKHGCLYCYATN